MRRLLTAIALMIAIAPAGLAQGRTVTVRLYTSQKLTSLRIVPVSDSRIEPRCTGCTAKPLPSPVTVQVRAGRLIQERGTAYGASAILRGTFRLEIPKNQSVALAVPVELHASGSELLVIARFPMESYVAAALSGESSNFRSVESMKAMAVTIRSYASHYLGRHKHEGFDFCDSTHCQDIRAGSTEERFRAAARATESEVLWHSGKAISAYYHQDCGGTTEDPRHTWGSRAPYLSQRADSYCIAQGRKEWASTVSTEELQQVARTLQPGTVDPAVRSIEVLSRTPSGRARKVRLTGRASIDVSAERFRLAVGRALGWERLRSDMYDVRSTGIGFEFHGYGSGHGVGMCQAGAARMGESGMSYRQILTAYYPGTKLGVNAQGLEWKPVRGERADMMTLGDPGDALALRTADRWISRIENQTSWRFDERPELRVYPTVALYRNSTGEPGFIAASTRDHVIRMQPASLLQSSGLLERTLQHELTHILIERRAAPGVPLWFREGLALVLSGDRTKGAPLSPAETDRLIRSPRTADEMKKGYASAAALVLQHVERHGRAAVLSWVERGIPK